VVDEFVVFMLQLTSLENGGLADLLRTRGVHEFAGRHHILQIVIATLYI
jgi:hypothetical protein